MGIQVEEVTRNLMPWGKEYIDFSFAGRHLSEFGLVAVTSGDRYQFAGSPDFEDDTSNVNGVWGLYYWGTNYKTKTYSYSLTTDGMTERLFEDFKRHFRPGYYGLFYEDTWFERYCYVRIKSVVNFTFIPFLEEIEMAGVKFPSRIYKGECKITFVQDRPFMFSFYLVLDTKLAALNTLTDNGKAAVRMMYHSNIPARDSWTKNTKCATGSWFSLPAIRKITKTRERDDGSIFHYFEYEEDNDNTNLFRETSLVPYYNPSTIASEANLEFTIKRSTTKVNLLEWEPIYFNEIYDDFTNQYTPYNTISTTGNINVNTLVLNGKVGYLHSFKYGLPEVSSDINKAIDIAWRYYQENIRGALVELQERLQEELINTRVLLWAIRVLQKILINLVLYRPEHSTEEEQLGILIDYDLTEEEQRPIQEDSESVLGEIIFHSGDYENRAYDEELDLPGCLRPDKIEVYPYPVYNYPIKVDWFGYFNLMMLMMFADYGSDIPTKLKNKVRELGDKSPITINEEEDLILLNEGFTVKLAKDLVSDYGISITEQSDSNILLFKKVTDSNETKYEQDDITIEGTFKDFYPYTLRFKGEEGQAFVSYKCNYLGSDSVMVLEKVLDENCSNIVASNYLIIDGGDKLDISTGKVETYHILGFNRGEDEAISVDNIKLEYKYTYA